MLKIFFFKILFEIFLRFFLSFFWEIFYSSNLGLLWFDLVVYQVSTFYYVWNWSKSLCAGVVVVVWWWLKPIIVFSLVKADQFSFVIKYKSIDPARVQNSFLTLYFNMLTMYWLTLSFLRSCRIAHLQVTQKAKRFDRNPREITMIIVW